MTQSKNNAIKREELVNEVVDNKRYVITKKTEQNKTEGQAPYETTYITTTNLKDDGTAFTEEVTLEGGKKKYIPQERTIWIPSKVLGVAMNLLSKKE